MPEESKRLSQLHSWLVSAIPRRPNNRETLNELQDMSLPELLFQYVHWAARLVAVRERQVFIESRVTLDPRWKGIHARAEKFFAKVESGEDLNPHLSSKAFRDGYLSKGDREPEEVNRWEDKDFLLNTMGYHHFHVGEKLEKSGLAQRTDLVIFARVSRETFAVLGIFNHSVFESIRAANGSITAERQRLWKIFDAEIASRNPPGTVVAAPLITMSGHPLRITQLVQEYSWCVQEHDHLIDDPDFVRQMYEEQGMALPVNRKLAWRMNFTDLGVLDRKNGYFFLFHKGLN